MEASNTLCWLWQKSIFLHSDNQSSIQKAGKKIMNCKNEVADVSYIATYLSQKKCFTIHGVYTKNNDFCYFHPASLCGFGQL